MNNLNIALAFVIGTILTPMSIAQTNAVPPPPSAPPPPLDEGQTWDDWTNSNVTVTFIRVVGSENPVTNIWTKTTAEMAAMPDCPPEPTEEQLEYARIWRKPQPRLVNTHKCIVPEAPADPRFIITAYTNLLNGEVAEITIRLPSASGFVKTSVVR